MRTTHNIDSLRVASDTNGGVVAEKRMQPTRETERICEVIGLLKTILGVGLPVVPHSPLVVGDFDTVGRNLAPSVVDVVKIDERLADLDAALGGRRSKNILLILIPRGLAAVHGRVKVNGVEVDMRNQDLQNRAVPIGPSVFATRRKLDGRIVHLHR